MSQDKKKRKQKQKNSFFFKISGKELEKKENVRVTFLAFLIFMKIMELPLQIAT